MFEKMTKGLLGLILLLGLVVVLGGCSFGETVQKISDDLGDKVLQGYALVDIWKIETSDATANGSPTGKKITIIGDIKSIPLVSRDGAIAKDYAEYRKTATPAWYNSDNITEEEVIVCTGDNAAEMKTLFLEKTSQIGKSKTVISITDSSGISYTRNKAGDNGTISYSWKSDKDVIVYVAKEVPKVRMLLYSDNTLKIETGNKISSMVIQVDK